MCVFPHGVLIFVECKAPGRKPSDRQVQEINRLKALGQLAVVVDSRPKVDALIQWAIQKGEDNESRCLTVNATPRV